MYKSQELIDQVIEELKLDIAEQRLDSALKSCCLLHS
jgi:capsular polysaccharide biosynthesis protein